MRLPRWAYLFAPLLIGLFGVLALLSLPAAAQSPKPDTSSPVVVSSERNVSPGSPTALDSTLYDQLNNDSGQGSSSQNFETALNAYDNYIADDFAVPDGQIWSIDRVDVKGRYSSSGPAASTNVLMYTNVITTPGALVASRSAISYTTSSNPGSFIIPLNPKIVLGPGNYWLSVQANQDFSPAGQWYWDNRTIVNTNPAVWENPGGGFGTTCSTWKLRTVCVAGDTASPDQVFRLSGSSSPLPIVYFSFGAYTVTESAGSIPIKVNLSASSPLTATVSYATMDGTALHGSDYIAASGTLTFTPGVTSQSFNVSIVNDTAYEGNEEFSLYLTSAKGATIVAPNPAWVTIVDNDPVPVLVCGLKTPGPWVLRNFLPEPAYGLNVVSDGKYAYAIGGYDILSAKDITSTVRYNPTTNSWAVRNPAPSIVTLATAVYAPNNNKIYVFGGEKVSPSQVYTSTLIYNISSNTWSNGAPMPARRAFMGGGYYNGKIYLVGGYSSGIVADAHAQTWEYNVSANTWLTKTSMTQPLGGAAVAVVNGHLYVIGGRDNSTSARNQTYDYDIIHDTWSSRLNIPTPVNEPGVAVLKDKIWVIGGGNPFLVLDKFLSLPQPDAAQTIGTTLIFDPALNSWAAGPDLNLPRSFIGAAGFGDFAVAIGGYNGITSIGAIEVTRYCPGLFLPAIMR